MSKSVQIAVSRLVFTKCAIHINVKVKVEDQILLTHLVGHLYT